jgi:AcrR family transcriptional regulator
MTTLTERLEDLPALAPRLSNWALRIYARRESLSYARSENHRPTDGKRREPTPFPSQLSTIDPHGDYERILSAVSRMSVANGYASLTVSKIRREAGVSRRKFDERFADSKTCFLTAIESLAARAAQRAVSWAAAGGGTGKFDVRTVLAMCAIGARNQRQAELVLATVLAPGRDGLQCRERLISEAAAWLSTEGRLTHSRGSIEAEASVAATWLVAQREVLDGKAEALPRRAALFYSLLT